MQPTTPETAERHAEPAAFQFSIFLSNRVGQLKEMLDLFAESELSLLGFSVVDATDWAVIRAVFSEPPKARVVLARAGLPYTESRVLLVELADDAAMATICGLLLQMEINIHFAYPLTIRSDAGPLMVLHVDDHVLAGQMLTRHGVRLLGDEDLADDL